MSTMSELSYDIEQLYIEGRTVREIAAELACSIQLVNDWIAGVGVEDQQEAVPCDTIS